MTRSYYPYSLISALAFAALAAHAQEAPKNVPAGYHLVWADEFNTDGAPDTAKWGYDTNRNKDGWWNDEAQYYAANRPENARLEGGHLIIEAHHEDLSQMPDYGGQHYSSARLVTRGKAQWTYGFFDIRAKLPCGVGQWPAIWLLGNGQWPDDGEIDIMEAVGFNPTTVYGTLHSAFTARSGTQQGGQVEVTVLCQAFHNYQTEWTPQRITFLVDGQPYYALDKAVADPKLSDKAHWPFDGPEFMILNVAIGGSWGGQHGIDDTALPAQMQVDYVRVYQKE